MNLATYAAYSGDAATAEQESQQNALDQSPWALQSLALAQTLQGQLTQAAQTYQRLGKSEELGPSYTASGLGDLALYEGRFADAARIFTEGAAADMAAKEADRAGTSSLRSPIRSCSATGSLRPLPRRRGRWPPARAGPSGSSRLACCWRRAHRREPSASPSSLGNDLQPESQALASIIDGMIALADGDNRNAAPLPDRSEHPARHLDRHFELGRAYLEANVVPAGGLGVRSLHRRRGEALELFLDDEPTFGYFPSVYYYQGRVREGLKSSRVAESVQRLPGHPRPVEGRSPGARAPQARRHELARRRRRSKDERLITSWNAPLDWYPGGALEPMTTWYVPAIKEAPPVCSVNRHVLVRWCTGTRCLGRCWVGTHLALGLGPTIGTRVHGLVAVTIWDPG